MTKILAIYLSYSFVDLFKSKNTIIYLLKIHRRVSNTVCKPEWNGLTNRYLYQFFTGLSWFPILSFASMSSVWLTEEKLLMCLSSFRFLLPVETTRRQYFIFVFNLFRGRWRDALSRPDLNGKSSIKCTWSCSLFWQRDGVSATKWIDDNKEAVGNRRRKMI